MPEGPVLIVDGHLDLAYNALFHRRDLTLSARMLREREDPGGGQPEPRQLDFPAVETPGFAVGKGVATVSLPDLRAGRVGIVLATIMSRVQVSHPAGDGLRTQDATYGMGQSHLAYYRVMERMGRLKIIHSAADLDACVAAWRDPTPETPIGVILSMESADPILGPDNVAEWWEAGLRSVGLTHFGINTYGHGSGTKGGLFQPAFALMDAMREAGMALDVSHAADLALEQIMDYWNGPIHASHCNCRALVPGQRHLTDEVIREIANRGGVIGAVFYEGMLNPRLDWDSSGPPTTATRSMSAVVDHIDHVCQLTGNCEHVAIGSDLDGGFGREVSPVDLDTVADLQCFLDVLRRRGYNEQDVGKIAHGNLLRFFKDAWRSA